MRWQKRFFILSQNGNRPAQLTYYKDADIEGNEARAILEITRDAKVEILQGKPHAFQVVLKGRALKVAAESQDDRDKWMKCLRDCIARAFCQTMVHVSCLHRHLSP